MEKNIANNKIEISIFYMFTILFSVIQIVRIILPKNEKVKECKQKNTIHKSKHIKRQRGEIRQFYKKDSYINSAWDELNKK